MTNELPGGSTPSQYGLPDGAKELQDLIEYRDMNFAVGNIFKAAYRLGRCSHSDQARDLRKIIWFAERELARVETPIPRLRPGSTLMTAGELMESGEVVCGAGLSEEEQNREVVRLVEKRRLEATLATINPEEAPDGYIAIPRSSAPNWSCEMCALNDDDELCDATPCGGTPPRRLGPAVYFVRKEPK